MRHVRGTEMGLDIGPTWKIGDREEYDNRLQEALDVSITKK